MVKNGDCEHDGIMEGQVIETRKCGQIVVRIRRCKICDSRVRTQEVPEDLLTEERERGRRTLEGHKTALRKREQALGRVLEALETLKNIKAIEDGIKAKT